MKHRALGSRRLGTAPLAENAMQFSKVGVVLGLVVLPLWAWACSPGAGQGNGDDPGGEDDGSGGHSRGGTSGAAGAAGVAGTAVITTGGSGGADGTGGGPGECVTCMPEGGTY